MKTMTTRDRTFSMLILLASVGQVIGAATISIDAFTDDSFGGMMVFTQPAGFIFSIWGLIYTLCIVFAIYQLFPSKNSEYLRYARPRVLAAYIGTVVWLWFAGGELSIVWLTVPTLAAIAWVLWKTVSFQKIAQGTSAGERLASSYALYPFAAWTLIATGVNVHSMLIQYGLIDTLFFNVFISVVILITVSILTFISLKKLDHSPWYGLVFVWATFGIVVANIVSENGALLIVIAAGVHSVYALGMVITKNLLR